MRTWMTMAFAAMAAAGCTRTDPADEALERNRAEVERLVFEDVEKYGVDIYRLYLEVSQMLPGMPDQNFGTDKAIRKLTVTYPDSNIKRLSDAFVVYGAIRRRDMMQVESYLAELERRPVGSAPQLMPNGYEIEPQLVAAQYNYFFQTGRLEEAVKTLDYLDSRFAGSWLSQPQAKPLAVSKFVDLQRRLLAVAAKKEGR